MEEEKETSSENKIVDARSAVDEAVEETKKRTILGDDEDGDDKATNEGAPDEHDEVGDVEKGSMENCNVEKDETGDGEPADDSDTNRSSPLQSSPPKRKKSLTGDPTSSEVPSSPEVDLSKQIYHVKWIGWHDTRCPIIMQNVNGPCPLLSMINVLLLRGKMTLKEGTEVVSSEQLLENIGERTILELPEPYLYVSTVE